MELQFNVYALWLAAARRTHPAAIHNAEHLPGWRQGYGPEGAEEFLRWGRPGGPDMQADVAAAWNPESSYGWVDGRRLVLFNAWALGAGRPKADAVALLAAPGGALQDAVVRAAATYLQVSHLGILPLPTPTAAQGMPWNVVVLAV